MIWTQCVGILVVLCIGLAHGWTETLEFDHCIPWECKYANKDKDYLIKWTGQHSWYSCEGIVKGYDPSNTCNKYKVCLKATEWDVSSSNVTLKYYAAKDVPNNDLQKTFTKYSASPDEWCSESGDYVTIRFYSNTRSSTSKVVLKAWAVKTNDCPQTTGIIVGSTIGGLVLLGIIVTVVIIIAFNKRKGMLGTVLTNKSRGRQIISTINPHLGIRPMAGFQSNPYSKLPPSDNQTMGYTHSGPQH